MKSENRIDLINFPFLRANIAIYLFLSFFEFAFTSTTGSLLKYYGFMIMGLWLVLSLITGNKLSIHKSTWFLLTWWLTCVMSLLWSKDKSTGFYYIYSIANMLCFLVVVQNVTWSMRSIRFLLLVYSSAAVLMSLLVITNGNLYHGVGIRYTLYLFGQEMDPNGISAFLSVPVIILFDFIVRKNHKVLSVICLCLCLYAMMLVASRSGLLSLLIGMLVFLICEKRWEVIPIGIIPKIKKKISLVVLFFVLIIMSKIVYEFVNIDLINRLFNFDNYISDRGSDRLDLWSYALENYLTSPIWGIGLTSYFAITQKGIHNMYLSVLCDVGIISILPFLLAFYSLLRENIKNKRSLPVAIFSCMMVYIFFLDVYQKKIMWNVIILATILLQDKTNQIIVKESK